jgi:allantoicase
MTEFTHLVDLASERVGGRAIAANDDFFAPKENLLKRSAPVFIPDKYTDRGKWMDGWESRRRRTPGHDWCIVRLGLPGILRSVIVDTAFFRGNFPSHCSLEACSAAQDAEPQLTDSGAVGWTTVLPKSELKGDTRNIFAIQDPHRFTHLRLNIYPDGGVARLRVLGEVLPDWRSVFADGAEIDLASVRNGGHVVDVSDRFFGEPPNMLMPDRAPNMGDGWETKRRRGPGHDWAIVRLGVEAEIRRIELDTAHYKGNYPDSCSIDGAILEGEWSAVLAQTKLQPDHLHVYDKDSLGQTTAALVRLNIYPDGGVSRFRVFGVATKNGRRQAMTRLLDSLTEPDARAVLIDCCGAPRWIDAMLAARPFERPEALLAASDATFQRLSSDDWLEALRHHPRIGERRAQRAQSAQAAQWSAGEQAGVSGAGEASLAQLSDLNRQYESRFGFVFLICASGRTADEIAAALRQRLENDPAAELATAAAEHRKITALRLEKLLT